MNNQLLSVFENNNTLINIAKCLYRSKNKNVRYDIPEIRALIPRESGVVIEKPRINLLIPSLQPEHVFGGISTALKFFFSIIERIGCRARIITIDNNVCENDMIDVPGFEVVSWKEDSLSQKQIVDMGFRSTKTLAVEQNDLFMATAWWTAYIVKDIILWQKDIYALKQLKFIYFIQDYEPGFYPWSTKYLLAESTYHMPVDTYAVVNSKLLYDYLMTKGYKFAYSDYFDPVFNSELKRVLCDTHTGQRPKRKNQILVYGRPSVSRNAFEMIIATLKKWADQYDKINEWTVYSVGEKHKDIKIGKKLIVHSLGKLTLDEYARLMIESRIGLSLMVSPHPSYPPLEMARFGMKVITNNFEGKDLSVYNKNIYSVESCSIQSFSDKLLELCNMDYVEEELEYEFDDIRKLDEVIDDWVGIL